MRIAVFGDFDASNPTHVATNDALDHAIAQSGVPASYEWIETNVIPADVNSLAGRFDAVWIAPGSPYSNMQGVLDVIRYAREKRIPLLGTCGGFQHIAIEYARNVAGIKDAEHEENNPYASALIVNRLVCSLKGKTLVIDITDKSSKAYQVLQKDHITESYYCNFGLNPEYSRLLTENGLRISASDDTGEARIIELTDHPFFLGTLFLPQLNSSAGKAHPIVTAFLSATVKAVAEDKAVYNRFFYPD